MKTIAFYSYKGGVGKSLAAVNLAMCLSRMGEHCVLLDLDFEGPSLPNKLPPFPKSARLSGGFVDFFMSGITMQTGTDKVNCSSIIEHGDLQGRERMTRLCWNPGLTEEGIEFHSSGNISASSFIHKIYGQASGGSKEKKLGVIHFLPAGDEQQEHYLSTILSPIWHRLTSFGYYLDQKATSEEFARGCSTHIRAMKEALLKLDPAPKFCILDLKSGALRLAETFVSQWMGIDDKLVYCTPNNREGDVYFRYCVPGWSAQTGGATTNGFEVVPVICRVPAGEEIGGSPTVINLKRQLRLAMERIPRIHSDRDLEVAEYIALYAPEPTISHNSRLAHDYVRLFARLLSTKDEPISRIDICQQIGLPESLDQVDRQFRLEVRTGALINPNDGSRNVSFKVETFQRLLRGLETGLEKEGSKKLPSDSTRFADGLHSAGIDCGRTFGKKLRLQWEDLTVEGRGQELGVAEKLRRWCEFDSDVGFGRFDLVLGKDYIDDTGFRRCVVQLHESFLAPCNDTFYTEDSKHRFRHLLVGYVQGVMDEIIKVSVKVTYQTIPPEDYSNRPNTVRIHSDDAWFIIEPIENEKTDIK